MNTQEMSRNDRETLSALFDGELPADARQFAMRRLAHDAAWQAECGRWQLIGDAMRKQAPIAAPADLAGRVRGEIEATAPAAAARAAVTVRKRAPMRMWAGAALAASVALVAVLVVRAPIDQKPSTAPAVASRTTVPLAPAVAEAVPAVPSSSESVVAGPAAAPAIVTVAVAANARRDPRTLATRSTRRADIGRSAETVGEPAAVAVASVDAPNPFRVPASDPLSARPWPRSVLSGGQGAFTASYGAASEAAGESPSFYPFEPRLQDAAAPRNEMP